MGAVGEMAGDVVGGIAQVASGALPDSVGGEGLDEFEMRMSRSGSVAEAALEGLTPEGTARAFVSVDDVGRISSRGETFGAIDSTGTLRLRESPNVPLPFELPSRTPLP